MMNLLMNDEHNQIVVYLVCIICYDKKGLVLGPKLDPCAPPYSTQKLVCE